MKYTRKEFFMKTLQGAAVIAVPSLLTSVLESCNNSLNGPNSPGSSLANVQGTLANGQVTVSLDSSSPIAKTGTAALVNFSNGSLLVDHPSSTSFNALSSICTHQGCQINSFDSGNSQFVCNCHGSRFDVSGNVVQGPAGSPLLKYTTQVLNNQLIIKVG